MMNLYSVYDLRARYYLVPFFSRSDEVATREFGVVVRDSGTMFNRHPQDFYLVRLGSFDDDTGSFSSLEAPGGIRVCSASDLTSEVCDE